MFICSFFLCKVVISLYEAVSHHAVSQSMLGSCSSDIAASMLSHCLAQQKHIYRTSHFCCYEAVEGHLTCMQAMLSMSRSPILLGFYCTSE